MLSEMTRSRARVEGMLALLLLTAWRTRPAWAQSTTAQCIATHENALELKKGHKVREARDAFLKCSAQECPPEVSAECADQLARVSRLVPSIVFAAKDAQGNDLSEVRVTIDGQALTDRLVGRAIEIDPGEHAFRFEAAGSTPIEKKLVVAEGETD